MKKAIIIGASSGIGKALAQVLAGRQYMVGITGRRAARLESIRVSHPQNIVAKPFDCSAPDSTARLQALVDELGGLNLLIYCAGTGELNDTLDFETDRRTLELNVRAFTIIINWAFNYFMAQGEGHVVAVTSIAGLRGSGLAPAYNASKAYQVNYLEGLRQKAQKTPYAVQVTDIRPGFVDTDMAKGEGLFWVASPEKAANQIFRIIKRRRKIGYVTKRWGIIAMLLQVLPDFIYLRM